MTPRCKCGKDFADIRQFPVGPGLIGFMKGESRRVFKVFVCDSCRSYWYSPDAIPLDQDYAFRAFDALHYSTTLCAPSIPELNPVDPLRASYQRVTEAYISGLQNEGQYHFYAEHIRETVIKQDQAIREKVKQIEALGDEVAELACKLRQRRNAILNELPPLARQFVCSSR